MSFHTGMTTGGVGGGGMSRQMQSVGHVVKKKQLEAICAFKKKIKSKRVREKQEKVHGLVVIRI